MKRLRDLAAWKQGPRRSIGRWILLVLSLPIMVGWLFPLIACLFGLASFRELRLEPTLVLSTVWRPWAAKLWGASTTLGRGIVYSPGFRDESKRANTRIERHEHVHVRQFEDASIAALFVGILALFWPLAWKWLVLWLATPIIIFVTQWLTAFARGGSPYLDAEFERSAYAQTKLCNNASWLEQREKEVAALADELEPDA